MILRDCPDNCSSNLRCKRATAAQLPQTVLYDLFAGCAVHKLHGFVTRTIGEDKVVGHTHACQFVLGIQNRRSTLIGALRQLLQGELRCLVGVPPVSYRQYSELVVKNTLMRRQSVVRARSGDVDDLQLARRGKSTRDAIPDLLDMLNGDIREEIAVHFCSGCCQDADGRTTREAQVSNVMAAILDAGLLGGVGHVVPTKSLWLSTSLSLSMLLAGMVFHNILPRVWARAFAQWRLPRAVDDNDYHSIVMSKTYRAKLWLTHDDTRWRSLVLSLTTGPVDHLMQVLQLRDAKGGALLDVVAACADPFLACARSYVDMLQDPESMVRSLLTHHFFHHGRVHMEFIMGRVLAEVLALAGRVWRHLHSFYKSWPYRLVEIVAASSTESQRRRVAGNLFAARPCCVDDDFIGKVRRV